MNRVLAGSRWSERKRDRNAATKRRRTTKTRSNNKRGVPVRNAPPKLDLKTSPLNGCPTVSGLLLPTQNIRSRRCCLRGFSAVLVWQEQGRSE